MIGCSLGRRAGMALCGAMLLTLAGCAGGRNIVPRSEFIPFTAEQRASLEADTSLQYRIQEGDLLKIRFSYERSLDQDDIIVLSDGSVNLIGVDRLRVAGLTMAEADSALTAAYSREYREPSLSVMVQDTKGRRVYVLGEVRDPGMFTVPLGGSDVVSAIALASGFTDDAAPEGTVIVRVSNGGYQFQEVNLETLGTADFSLVSTVPLRSYDIVYVPRSRIGDFAYFTRSVLTGLANVTRMAYDVYNVTNGIGGRY